MGQTKTKRIFSRPKIYAIALLLLIGGQFVFLLMPKASAGTLSKVMVRFDRMKQSTGGAGDIFTTGTVCAQPASAGTETSVKVTFPTGMTVSTSTSNWTTNTSSSGMAWPSGATGWLGMGTASSASGQDVTFPSSDLTVGSLYCFNWTNTSAALKTNTSTGNNQQGTITLQASGPSTIDSGTFQTSTISDDQIVVTATVGSTFSFVLSGSTDALGTLSTSSPTTSPIARTITINTSASNGWMVWSKDSNQGLNSSSQSYTIASNGSGSPCVGTNSTLAAGTEGYNLGIDSSQVGGSGTITVATPFVRSSTNYKGGGLCSGNIQTVTTSSGTANDAVLTLYNSASINGATRAATDYTDTETFIGAGIF